MERVQLFSPVNGSSVDTVTCDGKPIGLVMYGPLRFSPTAKGYRHITQRDGDVAKLRQLIELQAMMLTPQK